jgi:sensor histidine kinase YesM
MMLFNGFLLLLTTGTIYWSVSRIIIEQTSQARLDLLHETHNQLTQKIRDVEETALGIATHPVIQKALEEEPQDAYHLLEIKKNVNQTINQSLYTKPSIRSIRLYAVRFTSVIPTSNDRLFPYAEMPWPEEQIRAADSFWMRASSDEETGGSVISYVLKVYGGDARMSGVLEVELSGDILTRQIGAGQRGADRVLLELDSGNGVISRTGGTLWSVRELEQLSEQTWVKDISRQQEDGYRRIRLSGEDYVMLYSQPNHAQWRLLEAIRMQELEKGINTLRLFLLTIGTAGWLVSILIGYRLSSRIVSQITVLLQSFKRIEQGRFDTRMRTEGPIMEFAQLSRSFNQMAGKLGDMLEKLEEGHQALRKAEFKALQSQINPHFLYNTLDMINWMAAMRGAQDVSEVVAKLAKLFRISLSKGNPFVRLSEELEHASLYVQLLQLRFKEPFRYELFMNPGTDEGWYVPKLILQPFIENAVIHGFHGKPDQTSMITVTCQAEGKQLILVISNNETYAGSAFRETRSNKGSGGYGIANVRERLQLYFGAAYGVELRQPEQGGMVVILTLPILEDAEEWNRRGLGR